MRTRNSATKRRKTGRTTGDEVPSHGPSSSHTGSPGAESSITRFSSSISRATTPPTSSVSSPEPEAISCGRGIIVEVVIPRFFPSSPVRQQFEAVVIPQFFPESPQKASRPTFLGVVVPRFFGPHSKAPSAARAKRQAPAISENSDLQDNLVWTPIEGSSDLGYDGAVERISIRHRILANFRILCGELNRGQHDLVNHFDFICGISPEQNAQNKRTSWISIETLVLLIQKALTTIMTASDDPTFELRQTLMNTCHQFQTSTHVDGEEILLDCSNVWTILLDTCQSLPDDLAAVLAIMEETEEPETTCNFIPVLDALLQTAIDAHHSSALRQRQDSLGKPPAPRRKKPESERVQPQRKVNSQASKSKQTARPPRLPQVDPDKKMAEAVLSSSIITKDPEPLGTDPDGRVYWTCCPGPLEWQHAEMVLHPPAAEDEDGREAIVRRKKRILQSFPGETERSGMQRWSWIFAVWGTPPDRQGSNLARRKSKRHAPERWSGFHAPDDIWKLASWLEETYEDQDDDGNVQILADRIRNFAKLLQWRCKIADSR